MAQIEKNLAKILWHEETVMVTDLKDPPKSVFKAFSYTQKSLEPDPNRPYTRKVVKFTVCVLKQDRETGMLRTLPGLVHRLCDVLKKHKIGYQLIDLRPVLPKPDFSKIHSLRFSQEKLLKEALLKNMSGVISAPPRYGKTGMIGNTINAYPGVKTAILAPGIDLLEELHQKLQNFWCPEKKIGRIWTGCGKKREEEITVCSPDSIRYLDPNETRLIIYDEPHTAATGSRIAGLLEFEVARKIGFGGTVAGRWEGNDLEIEGLFGPKLSEITYKEAVAEGAVCPIKAFFIILPVRVDNVHTRDTAYNRLFTSKEFLNALSGINKLVPKEWQTLFFISKERHGTPIFELFKDENKSFFAMQKLMDGKERKQVFEDLKAGNITRCVCSNIYSTGVTIDGIRVAVNCAEGGANILSIQKPGRLSEIKAGKKYGYMIDFLFVPTFKDGRVADDNPYWKQIRLQSQERIANYHKIGYEVALCNSPEQIVFDEIQQSV